MLHKLMTQNSIAGFDSSKWASYLPDLVEVINEKTENIVSKAKEKKQDDSIAVNKNSKIDLLNVGDKIRVSLDEPMDVHGKKLAGKLRASDIRYNPAIKTIKFVLVKPNYPVMYQIEGENFARTREQLLPVNQTIEKETVKPVGEIEENRFEFEKILDKKTENRRVYYLVKWKHYPKKEATWEPASELKEDVPQAVANYEKKLKEKK